MNGGLEHSRSAESCTSCDGTTTTYVWQLNYLYISHPLFKPGDFCKTDGHQLSDAPVVKAVARVEVGRVEDDGLEGSKQTRSLEYI